MARIGRADWLAIAALLALDLAVYGRLLDPGRMLADYDAYVYFYPLRAAAATAVQAGRLPLWNPDSFLGSPFLANPQTALFYPFTALFFWLAVPLAYGINLALHTFLAGLAFYTFGRISLGVARPAALVGGMAFMLGGVLAGQYGHLNQISAVAWLPLVLLAAERAVALGSLRWAALGGLVVGLQFLAGHPQQSYMTLLVAGLVCLWRAWPWRPGRLLAAVGVGALLAGLGAALAAVQLVPTAELARESIRGAGLGYRDAVAGSLWPWLVARALLPSFANDLGSTEVLGYVGVVPLFLAAVALGVARGLRLALGLTLVSLGLFLALGGANPLYPLLYDLVPGLASFRVPARWLLLYAVGACTLAAVGLDWLLRRSDLTLKPGQWLRLLGTLAAIALLGFAVYLGGVRATRTLQATWLGLGLLGALLGLGCALPRLRRPAVVALVAVVGLELWAAGGDLPPRFPPPVEAYAQPRDSTLFAQSRLGDGRFLSVATEEYELKETPDYREWYGGLSPQTLDNFLIAAKRNEILTPNLNLLYQIPDVDGYDGGLLPLRRFLALGSLLVPPDRLRPDGVLISRLDSLQPRRLMDLLNLRVVLASRAKDYQDGAVVYDRALLERLGPGERLEVARVPRRGYTTLGLISWLDGPLPAPGETVGHVEVTATTGIVSGVPIVAGRDTALARPAAGALPSAAEVVHPWSWNGEGDAQEYLARLRLPAGDLAHLAIVNDRPEGALYVHAATLIDERDGAVTSLVLDDRLERTTFFDTKVYEYPDVLGRAYLVHRAVEADDDAARELLARPDFDPRASAVVAPGAGLALEPGSRLERVEMLSSEPELVRIRATVGSSALLVLSDAFYPGWEATVDGRPASIIRTNVAFRGVALPPGTHEVVFRYAPGSVRVGGAISALALVVLALLLRGRPPFRAGGIMLGWTGATE